VREDGIEQLSRPVIEAGQALTQAIGGTFK
jgi:hypothetical protein